MFNCYAHALSHTYTQPHTYNNAHTQMHTHTHTQSRTHARTHMHKHMCSRAQAHSWCTFQPWSTHTFFASHASWNSRRTRYIPGIEKKQPTSHSIGQSGIGPRNLAFCHPASLQNNHSSCVQRTKPQLLLRY